MARLGTVKLDAMIERVAPGWALKRAEARHDMQVMANAAGARGFGGYGGYAGGNTSRFRKSQAYNRSRLLSEDRHASTTLTRMQLECMDLYRNNPLAKSGVDAVVRYAGRSIPRAMSSSTEWNAAADDYFCNYFAKRADKRRRVDFWGLQALTLRSRWIWGDVAYIVTSDGMVPVEGMQIATPPRFQKDPNVVNGIRLRDGRIVAVYVANFDQYGRVDFNSYSRVPASSLIYCGETWRAAQVRSIPKMHSVVDMLRDHEETHENVFNKIKFEAMLLTKERTGAMRNASGSRTLSANSDGTSVELEDSSWGKSFRINGDPEDFQLIEGNTPSAQYIPTLQHQEQLIAAGLGMPLPMLLHEHTNGSYTAQRAARMDFMQLVNEEWQWSTDKFSQRVWNYAIATAIRDGRLDPAPVDGRGFSEFHKVDWSTPYMHEIDQGKEETARGKAFGNMTEGLGDWARTKGTTRERLLDAHDQDIREMKSRAEKIGVGLHEYAQGLVPKPEASEDAAPPAEENGGDGGGLDKWLK